LHIVDIAHPQFEDHIDSVNNTLKEIDAHNKKTIIVFNKIDAYTHDTIESDDLITQKTKKHYTLEEWKKTWMAQLGDRVLFISARDKENFETFKSRVYKEIRDIHVTRFPYNHFLYPEEFLEGKYATGTQSTEGSK